MAGDNVDDLIAKFGGKPADAAPATAGAPAATGGATSVDDLIAKFGGKPAPNAREAVPPPPGMPRPPALRELTERERGGRFITGKDGKRVWIPAPANPYENIPSPITPIVRGAERVARAAEPTILETNQDKGIKREVPQTANQRGKNVAGGLHDISSGVFELSTPLVAASAVEAPWAVAKALTAGTIAKVGPNYVLKKSGLPEEYAEFISDLLSLGAASKGPELASKIYEKVVPTEIGPIIKNKLNPKEREQIEEVRKRPVPTRPGQPTERIPITPGQERGSKILQTVEKGMEYTLGPSGKAQEFYKTQAEKAQGALEHAPEEIPAYRTVPGTSKVERALPAERSDEAMVSAKSIAGGDVNTRLRERGLAAKELGSRIYGKTIKGQIDRYLKTEGPKKYAADLKDYREARAKDAEAFATANAKYKTDFAKYGEDVDKYEAALQNGEELPERPVPPVKPQEPVAPPRPQPMKVGAEVDLNALRANLKDIYREMDQALPVTTKEASPGYAVLKQIMEGKDKTIDALKFDQDLSTVKAFLRSEAGDFAHSRSYRFAAEFVNNAEDVLERSLNKVNPKLVPALRKARIAWREFRETDELLQKLLPKDQDPIAIFNKITDPSARQMPLIRRLNRVAPNEMKTVAQAYLRGLVEKATRKGGISNIDSIGSQFSRMDSGLKEALFGKDVAYHLQLFLDGLSRLKLADNPSGTAKWRWVIAQITGPLIAAANAVRTGQPPMEVTGLVAIPAAQAIVFSKVANLLFDPKGIRLLTRAVTMPQRSAASESAWSALRTMVSRMKPGPEAPPPAGGGPSTPPGGPGGSPPPSGGAPPASAKPPETPPPARSSATPQAQWQAARRAAPAQYAPIIEKAAADYGIESGLLTALLRQESNFNPNAVSPKGAEGIAQFIKGTAKQMGLSDAFNPEEAIPAAAKLLAVLRDQFNGDMRLAVAAYNAGAGAVRRVGGDIAKLPRETQDYVERIYDRFIKRQPAVVKSEIPPSQRVSEAKPPASQALPQEQPPPNVESARRLTEGEKPAEERPEERPSLQEGRLTEMPVSEISVDPERFQFKSKAVGRAGVGDKLQDVKTFDPEKGGILAVWKDPADGKTYIVNGHHRHELATRLGYDKPVPVRQIQANTDTEARTIGALINIAEGQGEAIDAAKVFRDSKMTPAQIQTEFGLSPRNPLVRLGQQLAKLADGPFRAVANGDVSEGRGAIIGELLSNPVDQEAAIKISKMADERGRKMADPEFREVVRLEVARAPRFVETQETLFGTQEEEQNLALERGDVSQYIRQQLSSDRQLFKKVADESAGSRLGEEGNTINVKGNADRAKMVSQIEALYEKLSTAVGPVSDILDQAAKDIADGQPEASVKRRAYQDIQESVRAELRRLLGPQGSGAGEAGVPPPAPVEESKEVAPPTVETPPPVARKPKRVAKAKKPPREVSPEAPPPSGL